MPLASIGSALISGILANRGAKAQNRAASAQALRQMQFQERMSSSAHQREVKDLRAAGLNPILSATGGSGASSPGGAQAPVVNELTPAVTTALQAAMLRSQFKVANTQADANSARALLSRTQAGAIAPVGVVGSAVGGAISRALQPFRPGSGLFDTIEDFFKGVNSPSIRTPSALEGVSRRGSVRIGTIKSDN